MTGVLRGFLKLLAVVIAMAPFALAALLVTTTTSLAVVAPTGLWMLVAFFVVPVLLGIALWRVSALVRSPPKADA
jgi:hypothetical protein